jgi:hypothetical protein
MVAFAQNRRHNGMQLGNSIRFLACGVSKTVNEYLHQLGLSSSCKTVLVALGALSQASANQIIHSMSLTQQFAPPLCIDNLDMEERVHMGTVGQQTRRFHGTWGYIHISNRTFFRSLELNGLDLASYHNSLKKVEEMVIEPEMFLPEADEDKYAVVWKS